MTFIKIRQRTEDLKIPDTLTVNPNGKKSLDNPNDHLIDDVISMLKEGASFEEIEVYIALILCADSDGKVRIDSKYDNFTAFINENNTYIKAVATNLIKKAGGRG